MERFFFDLVNGLLASTLLLVVCSIFTVNPTSADSNNICTLYLREIQAPAIGPYGFTSLTRELYLHADGTVQYIEATSDDTIIRFLEGQIDSAPLLSLFEDMSEDDLKQQASGNDTTSLFERGNTSLLLNLISCTDADLNLIDWRGDTAEAPSSIQEFIRNFQTLIDSLEEQALHADDLFIRSRVLSSEDIERLDGMAALHSAIRDDLNETLMEELLLYPSRLMRYEEGGNIYGNLDYEFEYGIAIALNFGAYSVQIRHIIVQETQ